MSGLRQSALTIGVILFVGCVGVRAAVGKRVVAFADECYSIPEWNAKPINASPFWPGTAKRESERSVTLRFTYAELARSVSSDTAADGQQGVLVSFFAPTAPERAQRDANRKGMHHDIWYALGEYRGRTIEPIPGTTLLRVYPLAGGDNWMVVTRTPDAQRRDTHLRDDFWIATCQRAGPRRARICTADVEAGRYLVTLSVGEPDLVHREEAARHAVKTLGTWRIPCNSPQR